MGAPQAKDEPPRGIGARKAAAAVAIKMSAAFATVQTITAF
jgi:hypothetical protein